MEPKTGPYWLNGVRGWLKNPERKARRFQTQTLTDEHVQKMITNIESNPSYTKLDGPYNTFLKIRDKALISLSWIFFKRASEILNVRLSELYYDEKLLYVTFHVKKKSRKIKVCPMCKRENKAKSGTCKHCQGDISNVEPIRKEPPVVTKRKNLDYPYCKYVFGWCEVLKQFNVKDAYLFPPLKCLPFPHFLFDKKLTTQRFDQILHKLDNSLSTNMFRYGKTEMLISRGYTPFELTQIGDWETSNMPELYAQRKGLTPALKKFEQDIRV
jgi:integrase